LLREAKNRALANGKLARNGKPQSWRKIGLFVENLLTLTDALLDESGKPIGRGIRAKTAPVHKLADSWQEKADAQIILRLVDLFDDFGHGDHENPARVQSALLTADLCKPLGHDDHENLAGVLFLSRDQVACDRIEAILKYLVVEVGQLKETEVDGRLIYRKSSQGGEVEQNSLRMAQ
jgi:hypothetical protein